MTNNRPVLVVATNKKYICLCIVGHRLKTGRGGGTGGLFACKVGHSRCVGIIRDKHHKKDW